MTIEYLMMAILAFSILAQLLLQLIDAGTGDIPGWNAVSFKHLIIRQLIIASGRIMMA